MYSYQYFYIKNYLFGTVKLTKNTDKSKFSMQSFGNDDTLW